MLGIMVGVLAIKLFLRGCRRRGIHSAVTRAEEVGPLCRGNLCGRLPVEALHLRLEG